MYAGLPALSKWLAIYKNCDTSVSHTLTCYRLVLFMVFNTIKISRMTFEEDILVIADIYREIIDHPSLGDLAKPWLRQSLPSQQLKSAVSGALAWGLKMTVHREWSLLCTLHNPACYIISVAIFLPLMTFLAASWDELGVNWDELGYPDAEREGRTAVIFFFPGEGMDTSSVNTSKTTAHYLSILTSLQMFWTFSGQGYTSSFYGLEPPFESHPHIKQKSQQHLKLDV